MHQDDETLVDLLNKINKIRVGQLDQNIEHVIKLRFVEKNDISYPSNVLQIFSENTPV